LQQKWNAGERPVSARRDAARLGARLIEPARDDGIEGRVQRLDASDGGFADLGGADLAAPHEIGKTEGIMSAIILGLHVHEPVALPGVTHGASRRKTTPPDAAPATQTGAPVANRAGAGDSTRSMAPPTSTS